MAFLFRCYGVEATYKMRVLLSNKFYYRRGGDCIYMMELEQLLKAKGHDVAVFSMQYPQNFPSIWSRYWPSNMSIFKVLSRPFGDSEVKRKFNALLDDFNPDVVHLNNIHTHLSPIIAEIAHSRGIRVVWTLHDSKLVCPCYACMRKGNLCVECFTRKESVLRHRCMRGGLLGSIIGYWEAKKWNKDRIQHSCDLFLTPSRFISSICINGGYDESKFLVLNNFVDLDKVDVSSFDKKDYYVYLGRLTKEKGIGTLCEVASRLPYKLVVIGGGDLERGLRDKYADSNIDFLGKKNWHEFCLILASARFMVIPSECMENNPLSVIESLALGTPVLGANIGGIPELIDNGFSGMTFESGNQVDLRNKIELMWSTSFDYGAISSSAQDRYSSDKYMKKIIEVYKNK